MGDVLRMTMGGVLRMTFPPAPVILRSASDEGSSSYSHRRRKKILRSAQDDIE